MSMVCNSPSRATRVNSTNKTLFFYYPENTTGKESIYNQYHNYEIMFHVSTLLPYFPDDEQKVRSS